MPSLPITCIVAADSNNGIARAAGHLPGESDLPWNLPVDLARFKRLTIGAGNNAVLMGRATWDTLPPNCQPLPRRKNIVFTRSDATFRRSTRVASWTEALAAAQGRDHLWVVGGAQIQERGFNLDISNPNAPQVTHEDPDVLLARYERERAAAAEIRDELKQVLAAALEGRA